MGPLRGSGVGALRQTRGPQQPNPQSRRGRTGIRKVNGEKSNRLWTRRRQQNRCGDNRTQGRGRKRGGKLGKTEPNPSGGKHKPYQKTMLRRYTKEGGKPEMAGTWSTGVGNKGRENRTQGRGRKPKGNTPGTRAGRPVEDRCRS